MLRIEKIVQVFIFQGDSFKLDGYLDQRLLSADFEDFEGNLDRYNRTFLTILALGS